MMSQEPWDTFFVAGDGTHILLGAMVVRFDRDSRDRAVMIAQHQWQEHLVDLRSNDRAAVLRTFERLVDELRASITRQLTDGEDVIPDDHA